MENKKNIGKKTLALMMALMLLIGGVVGGTLALLVSTPDPVINTFTVGKVVITLDESPVNLYGVVQAGERVKANTYKLIPGQTYTKNPTIHVEAGSEACYLFVKVENGIANIEAGTTIAQQLSAQGWEPLDGVANVFYKEQVAVTGNDDVDVPVFASFTLADNADVAAYASAQIVVTAYAVQKDNVADAKTAWTTAFPNP